MSESLNDTLDAIKKVYTLKEEAKEPAQYLGANTTKLWVELNGNEVNLEIVDVAVFRQVERSD